MKCQVFMVHCVVTTGHKDCNLSLIYNQRFLCLFIRVQLYDNTLHNWVSLSYKRRIRTILYVIANMTSSSDVALMMTAVRLGWTVLPAPRVNHIGLPFLKDMYYETEKHFPDCIFYGFANGDILFNVELAQTLHAVATVCIKLFAFTRVNMAFYQYACNVWYASVCICM